MKIWNLQSLLVCPILLWRVSLTRDDWILGWRSELASLILNWCLILIRLHRWWVNRFWYGWTPWIQFLWIMCCRGRNWICKIVSRKSMRPIFLAAFLRLGIPRERLSIPSGIGWGGKDTGWLVTWRCPLRTDSASWKSLEPFIQSISLCNSCILPVNSKIVSRSSINFLLAIVSNVEPWNRFNSSISLRLFPWAPRRSQVCFNNCSWRSWWSFRRRSSAWARWSSSCCDSIVSLNFCILLLLAFQHNNTPAWLILPVVSYLSHRAHQHLSQTHQRVHVGSRLRLAKQASSDFDRLAKQAKLSEHGLRYFARRAVGELLCAPNIRLEKTHRNRAWNRRVGTLRRTSACRSTHQTHQHLHTHT